MLKNLKMFKFNNSKNNNVKVAYFMAALIVVINLFFAEKLIVLVPWVDGWAVWNRVMLLDFGEISWVEYLFTPHGAHPHSIVYLIAWFDFHWAGGKQQLMMSISFICIFVFVMFITRRVLFWLNKTGINNTLLWLLSTSSAAAFMSGLTDYETLIQPFQVVISFSRLVYILLLWSLIVNLRQGKLANYLFILILSCMAVTFHGAGYIFAAVFLLLHLLYARHIGFIVGAVLPIILVFIVKVVFSQGGAELSQIGAIISLDMVGLFIKGIFAYFATPLLYFLPLLGKFTLLLIGSLVFIATLTVICISFYKTCSLISKNKTEKNISANTFNEYSFVFACGVFILLSAAAASVMWLVRTNGAENAVMEVLTTARYGAYACLSYVIVLCSIVQMSSKFHLVKLCSAIVLLVAAMSPSLNLNKYYIYDDELNIASAGLSAGLSPTNVETEFIWPGAKDDWYWVNALPKTVAYLRGEKKGPWIFLPDLYAKGDFNTNYIEVSSFTIKAVKSDIDHRRCNINAMVSVEKWATKAASILTALVNNERKVIGYGVLTRRGINEKNRELVGFVLCTEVDNTEMKLYSAPQDTIWSDPLISEVIGTSAVELTDQTWNKGIARNWAGFFIVDTPSNRGIYVPGRMLRFSNGQLRVIIRQEIANGYVNIFLDGIILDGNKVGYPSLIKPLN